MAKKEIKRHQKAPSEGMWHGRRLEGEVKNTGIKPVQKPKQKKDKPEDLTK